jgi:hypothetical protein
MPPESSDGSFFITMAGSRFTPSSASHTLRTTSGERACFSSSRGRPVQTFSNTFIESKSAAYWKT